MFLIHDDCLFHILSFLPSVDLFKNCLLVSKQFHENGRRVSFKVDLSANLQVEGYSFKHKKLNDHKSDNNSLIRANIDDLLNCEYFERLESLNLSFNNIGSHGAKVITENTYLKKNLRELLLNGCTIMEEGLGYLLNNVELVSKLTRLGLSRCRLTDNGMHMLASNKSNLENLKYLDLEYNTIGMIGFEEFICNLPCNLTDLNMGYNRLDDEGYLIKDSIPELGLESLDLSCTSIQDENLTILTSTLRKLKKIHLVRMAVDGSFKKIVLDNLPQLTYLDISSINANNILPDLHSCDKLKTLIMNRCRLKNFNQLNDNTYLAGIKHISLMDNPFTDSNVLAIAQTAKKRGIDLKIDATINSGHRKNFKQLLKNLADHKVSLIRPHFEIVSEELSDVLSKFELVFDDRLPSLNNCAYLRNVTRIDIYDHKIGDEGFRNLFTNNIMVNLRELRVGYNGIKEIPSPDDCHDNLKSLTHLDLKYNLIGDDGIIQIANNPYLTNLRELEVEINGITKEGIKHLISSPFMQNINDLNLDGAGGGDSKNYGIQPNTIGDEGFELLLNSNLNNLLHLCVSCNGLGNESAKVLANHKGAKNLVELIMFENSFNDEVIPYLTSPSIAKFHTLRVLYHEISDEGVALIEESPFFSGIHYSI